MPSGLLPPARKCQRVRLTFPGSPTVGPFAHKQSQGPTLLDLRDRLGDPGRPPETPCFGPPDRAREVYRIPDGFRPLTGLAIGYVGNPDTLPQK